MAFGNRSSNSGSQFGPNTKVYYVSIKEKDLDQPYFEIKTKEGDEYVIVHSVKDKIKYLGGHLVDLRNKVFKHEGKDIESTSATFVDYEKDEAYILTISQGFLGRNILNSILNLKTFDGLEIGLYASKPKPGHDKGFNSAALRQNQALIYGKFKNEELPKIPKVKVGKDIHSDPSEINAFFTKLIEEFAKVIKAAAPKHSAARSASAEDAEHAAESAAHNEEQSQDSGDSFPDDAAVNGGKAIPF